MMKNFTCLTILPLLFLIFSSFSPQDPVQEEIRRNIETRAFKSITVDGETILSSKGISDFYINRIFEPVLKDKKSAMLLIHLLKKASEEGLDPADYHSPTLEKLAADLENLPAHKRAEFDILAADALLLFVSHLYSGKVNPQTIDPEWHVIRREGNPLELAEKILQFSKPDNMINEITPQHGVYGGLKQALVSYRKIREAGGWEEVPGGETLKKGMTGARVTSMKTRLSATHDYKGNTDSEEFDEELEEALIRFQKRHGLDADGVAGKSTLAAMNVPVDERIRQIRVNLERWRWLPQDPGDHYIIVNIADFSLDVVKKGKTVRHHKAIVGRDYRRTPVFSSEMSYLVLSPTWTIPPGILAKDIIPAVRKNPGYLKGKNIELLNSQGIKVDVSSVDWSGNDYRSYTFRQAPGPENALGTVKFMFPNKFTVYLHDTPARELFEKSERTFSSGCVRVKDALELAEYLLDDQQSWNMEKIKKQVALKKPTTVSLKAKPKIHLLYWTAWREDNGTVHFRKDIYKRDLAVISALEKNSPS